jgi:hypothetical protein
MQRHSTSQVENKRGKTFKWGSGGWEAEACTPRKKEKDYAGSESHSPN